MKTHWKKYVLQLKQSHLKKTTTLNVFFLDAKIKYTCSEKIAENKRTDKITSAVVKNFSEKKMIITNIESIPGKRITEHYGIVSGSTVRAKHAGRDILAGLKNLVGGELKGYTELLSEAREESLERMTTQAKSMGANAVINVRFSTSSVTQGASELYVYGTAVRVEN